MTMNDQKVVRVKERLIMKRDFTTRVGTLELKVPRTRDGELHRRCLSVISEMKRHWLASMLEMYVSGVFDT